MTYRDEFRDVERETYWTLPKLFLLMLAAGVALWGLGLLFGVLRTAGSVASAPGRVVQRTLETDNIIYNYEWFKSQHEQIGAVQRQAETAKAALDDYKKTFGDPKTWGYQTQAEYSRLQAVHQGLLQQRANYVAQYNARAKMANRSIFMGRDLPTNEE